MTGRPGCEVYPLDRTKRHLREIVRIHLDFKLEGSIGAFVHSARSRAGLALVGAAGSAASSTSEDQMTKLTHAQRDLLTQAASAETGEVEAGETQKTVGATLIKRGLMISVPRAEGGSHLMITEAGRNAISQSVAPAPAKAKPPKPEPEVEAMASPAAAPKGKVGILLNLLRQPQGATIEAMTEATGWQAHSVRGAISGSIKKALSLEVSSEKTEAGRIYRIVEGALA